MEEGNARKVCLRLKVCEEEHRREDARGLTNSEIYKKKEDATTKLD